MFLKAVMTCLLLIYGTSNVTWMPRQIACVLTAMIYSQRLESIGRSTVYVRFFSTLQHSMILDQTVKVLVVV